MRSAEYWVSHLNLQPHPEGGFDKETYRSKESIPENGLSGEFKGSRNFSTAIYFLLRSKDRSLFHRIRSDELWHFHDGSSLTIYILEKDGLVEKKLGNDPSKGESLQVVVPAHCWFGAMVNQSNSYTLSGCTVAPGFDFRDFEMAKGEGLLNEFPQHHKIIALLTH